MDHSLFQYKNLCEVINLAQRVCWNKRTPKGLKKCFAYIIIVLDFNSKSIELSKYMIFLTIP